MLAVLASVCVLSGPAMWVPGSEVSESPRSPARPPGALGPWSLGGPEGGFEQGSLWQARIGRNAEAPMLAAESALSPLVARTQPGRDHQQRPRGCARVVEALRFNSIGIELDRLATREGRLCEQASLAACMV